MEGKSRDILAIDAEAGFVGANPKRPATSVRFIDNISNAESYYFESLPHAKEFNETESPELVPFRPAGVRAKSGGR